jgi:hypothetical protein
MRVVGVALMAVALVRCTGNSQGPAIISHYSGRLDSADSRYIRGLRYDPSDSPLRWTSAGNIILAHVERYSYADVGSETCAGSGIYTVAALGDGGAKPIAVGRPDCAAALTRDGAAVDPAASRIVFAIHVLPNNSRLARLDLGTGRIDTLVTDCAVYSQQPALSADGRLLAIQGLCRDRSQQEWALYMMRADGSQLRQVVEEDSVSDELPSWNPDGTQIAFQRTHDADSRLRHQVAIVDTSGRRWRVVTNGSVPSWSPDGQWIAFMGSDSGPHWEATVRLIHPDGSGEHVIFVNHVTTTYSRGWGPMPEGLPWGPLVWSPDSRALAFTRDFDRGRSIWRVDISSDRLDQVTAPDR